MLIAELISALERAEGPDRELDEEIDWQLFAQKKFTSRSDCYGWPNYRQPRDYTRSLDAAMTLVPAQLGIMWDVAKYPGGEAAAYVGQKDAPVRSFVIAATPAIAFCIAALKAREKETE